MQTEQTNKLPPQNRASQQCGVVHHRLVRDEAWRKKRTIDEDARAEVAKQRGYRLATYGDGKASHAICKHGHLAEITEDHHACSWTPLVPNVGSEPFSPAQQTPPEKP